MQKSIYYSGQTTAAAPARPAVAAAYRPAAQRHAVSPRQAAAAQAVAAQPAKSQFGRSGLLVLVGCLVLAMMVVLLVPLMVDGASAPAAASGATVSQADIAYYESLDQAAGAIGLKAVYPAALPEGYAADTFAVIDGAVLEVAITNGRNTIVFRTAAGSDDLSNGGMTSYAFTATETVDEVARGYAGVSEKKLNLAVWANGGFSYALLAADGLDAQVMRQLAESVG